MQAPWRSAAWTRCTVRRASRPARTRRPWRQARAREHDPRAPAAPLPRGARAGAALAPRPVSACELGRHATAVQPPAGLRPPPVRACGAAHRARPSARRRARPRARRQAAPRSWRAPRACATCRRRWRRAWRAGTRSATSAGGSTWACRSARAAAAGSCAWACAAARSATRSRRARRRPAVEPPSSGGAPAGETELTADSEPSRVFRGLINGQAPACQRMGFASHPAECPTCRRNSPARRMCKLAPAGWWHGRGAAPVTGQGIIHLTLQVRRLLAAEARLLARYERSLLESYVEDNAMTRWCPRCPSPLNPDPNPNSCPHRWQPFSPCWRACDGCARGGSPCVS